MSTDTKKTEVVPPVGCVPCRGGAANAKPGECIPCRGGAPAKPGDCIPCRDPKKDDKKDHRNKNQKDHDSSSDSYSSSEESSDSSSSSSEKRSRKNKKDCKKRRESSSSSSSCSSSEEESHHDDRKKPVKRDDHKKRSESCSSSSSSSEEESKKDHRKKDDHKKRSKSSSSSCSSSEEESEHDRKDDHKDDRKHDKKPEVKVEDKKPEQVIQKIDNGWYEPFCCDEKPCEKQYPTVKIQIQKERHRKDSCGKEEKSKVIAYTAENFLASFNESVRVALKNKDVALVRETLRLLNLLSGVPVILCNSLERGREFTAVCERLCPSVSIVNAVKVGQCNKGAQPAYQVQVRIQVFPILNATNCEDLTNGKIALQFGEAFNLQGLLVNLEPPKTLEEQGITLTEDGKTVIYFHGDLDICKCYAKDIGILLTGNELNYTGFIAIQAGFEAVDYNVQYLLQFREVRQLLCQQPE